MRKALSVFILFFVVALAPFFAARAETYFGNTPTGLLELSDLKYPAYLFVPEHYEGKSAFGLIVSLAENSEDLQKHIQDWAGAAQKKSMLMLALSIAPREINVPYKNDEWLIQLKNEVKARYRIDPTQIFLVGRGPNAHYAAYLAVNYPQEFSGAALLNGSWAGPFEKLMRFQSRAGSQVPFFVSFEKGREEGAAEAEKRATRLSEMGYPVHLERLEAGDESFEARSFQERLMDWLKEKGQSWQVVVQEQKKTSKEKFRSWFHRNVKVI